MSDSFSEWFNKIEQKEDVSARDVDTSIFNIPEGEVPPLPKYKKCVHHTPNDNWYGKLKENVSYYDGYESAVTIRCKTCGALQWVGQWHEFRKERCAKCEAILDFKDIEDRNKDWEDHWKMKPLELEIAKKWKDMIPYLQEKIMGIK